MNWDELLEVDRVIAEQAERVLAHCDVVRALIEQGSRLMAESQRCIDTCRLLLRESLAIRQELHRADQHVGALGEVVQNQTILAEVAEKQPKRSAA